MYKHILFVLLAGYLSGCNWLDKYVEYHTSVVVTETEGDVSIDLRLEDAADLDISEVTLGDLLTVQRLFYETVLPHRNTLLHATVFLPHDATSWTCMYNLATGRDGKNVAGSHTTDTDLARYLVLINPDVWRTYKRDALIEVYIHELTHEAAYLLDGDTDGGHKRTIYWGEHGLVQLVLTKWLAIPNP